MTPRDLLTEVKKLFIPPPALPVWQWAELRRRMGKDVTAAPGRYSADFAPYQKEPQESFTDPSVQMTVLYWGKRLGKTEIELNLVGAVMEQDPDDILIAYPTIESGEKWSKQCFTPMVRSTPELHAMIPETGRRESGNTLRSKAFPGGRVSIIGANSPTAFRQIKAPIVICDEVDAMENGKEGDPVLLALGRAENYKNSIQVLSSTATFLETSRIHAWYLKSDQRKWFVKAPCCGKYHVLAWNGVKWPKDKPEEAYYECPDCGNHWDDKRRVEAIRAGEWRPTAPFKGIRGYWLNGLNTVFPAKKGFKTKLHQFAGEFLDAYHSGESSRLVWKNTFLCEPEEIKGETVEKQPLLERREDYSGENLPNQVLFIVCSVDVQKHRLEYEVVGVGENEETWGIEYGRIMGDTDGDQVWKDLGNKLSQKFTRKDGIDLRIVSTAIDHGYRGEYVMKFVRRGGIPNVHAVYGVAGRKQSIPFITNQKRRLTAVNTDHIKDLIFSRLQLIEEGPRYMHFPLSYEDGYFEQLTSEEKRVRYKNGFAVYEYHKAPSVRNEALDLRVYSLAAVKLLNPDVPSIKKNLELRAKDQAAARPYQLKKFQQEPVVRKKRMQFQVPTF